MAEGYVNVTEGSGKKLHSYQRVIGTNTVEDEVTLFGEPYVPSYVCSQAGGISTATLDSHIFQLMAGSTLHVYVRRIEIYQASLVTTAALIPFGLYRLTTAGTGGTSVTPRPLDTDDSAAGATGQTLPSSKGTEGVRLLRQHAYLAQTAPVSPAGEASKVLVLDFPRLIGKALRIPAGTTNGIAVKIETAAAGGAVHVAAYLYELNF